MKHLNLKNETPVREKHLFFLFREFQLMTLALDNSFLLSDQDINKFLV